MLPWLARHLPSRIVLVVRHPGAVVESELRGRWNASYALDRFKEDARLHSLTQDRYRPLLARKSTHVESLAVRWVIENQWVMESARVQGMPVIHYEALRSTDGAAWTTLCAALDLACQPDREVLTRPSQQSGAGRAVVPLYQSERPRWMSGLSAADAHAIQGILDMVSFHEYSMDDPSPHIESNHLLAADQAGARS
jgi:hypothetical protein